MRKLTTCLACVASVAALLAAPQAGGPDVRLVLLIAVDQFRYDYLTRFRTDYTAGFNRLLTNGAVFTNANLEHYPTVTAVGHATMLSGAYPSASGIIGNDWFDRGSGKSVASITDDAVKTIGADSGGAASPGRLLVETVGDELRKASKAPKGDDRAPRVIGMSLKDRAAILPVGRSADAAYWLDTRSGNFVTSSYYVGKAPDWLTSFNNRHAASAFAGEPWSLFWSPQSVLERMPPDGPGLYAAVYGSPFGNDLLLSFADAALTQERLGQRGVMDLLAVSFSSNDAVGHTYGPDSDRVRDISIKTDRVIGRLLDRVGQLVGLEHVIVGFTSDHGVAPLPETRTQEAEHGGRMSSSELPNAIQAALSKRFGEGKWVLGMAGTSPYLNYALIEGLGLDQGQVRRMAAEAAAGVPHVTRVFTRDDLQRRNVPNDPIAQRVLRSFNPARSGDLEILLEPYWMRQATGTTHGTPYDYDAHIPLILMGAKVKPGIYESPVALNDLAPTVSTLAGVGIPSASAGRVLKEAIR